MAFVNEYISPEDRERYRLADFESMLRFTISPQDWWAIDRAQNIFLRLIRPAARKSEPGDSDARFEKDFQFHWKGHDYMVCLRSGLSAMELQNWPGEIFSSLNSHPQGEEVLRIYLRHIGEMGKPSAQTNSAWNTKRQQALSDLEYALAFSFVGVFSGDSSEEAEPPRHALIKIAPRAEVTA
jgi:hypothetical protein